MLANPGFEDGLDGWHIGTTQQSGSPPVTIDSQDVVAGSQACKIANTGTSHIHVMEQNALVPTAGEYYFFEGHLKTAELSANRGVVFMEFYDDQWQKVSEWVHLDLTTDNTQPYTRMAGMFRAPTVGSLAKMGIKAGIWNTEGTVWLDELLLAPVENPVAEDTYEAEDAVLGGGATVDANPPSGFSGDGAVRLDDTGAYVEWTVASSAMQECTIAVRWRERRELVFTLNGDDSSPRTWHWGNVMGSYATRSIHRTMAPGENVIRITNSGGGLATIDKITVLRPEG